MRRENLDWRNFGPRSRRDQLIWLSGIFAASFAVVMLFQNCTQPVTGTDSISAAADEADFAYDTNLDQIAYMSCSNMPASAYDTSAYFTFRAGAYRNAGITLNSSFLSKYGNASPQFKSSVLQESTANNSTVLQLAVRPINSYQNIVTASSSSATLGQDYDNLFANLGELNISDMLAASAVGARIRYIRDGTATGARLEGSIRFATSYAMMSAIRTGTTNGNYLALTYANNNSTGSGETLARSPTDIPIYSGQAIDANRIIYGHGFALGFGQPSVSGIYGNFPQQVLRSVSEVNLQSVSDRTGIGNWNCPTTMQFRIVQRTDLSAAGANCNLKPDPPTLSADLQIVRLSLRSEDWYVDMDNHCIIPKKTGTGCYGDSTTVNYDLTTACDPNQSATLCTSYASICYRN